jgi:hypothetical protein
MLQFQMLNFCCTVIMTEDSADCVYSVLLHMHSWTPTIALDSVVSPTNWATWSIIHDSSGSPPIYEKLCMLCYFPNTELWCDQSRCHFLSTLAFPWHETKNAVIVMAQMHMQMHENGFIFLDDLLALNARLHNRTTLGLLSKRRKRKRTRLGHK